MLEFFTIVLVLVWLIVASLMFVGTFLLWDDFGPAAGIACAFVGVLMFAGLMVFIGHQDDTAMNHCMDSGRAWAIVGHHTDLVFNAATKTSIPQDVTDYGCVERR